MFRAYKYRLYPTVAQVARLEQTLETHRRLYNDALAERKTIYETERRAVGYFEQNKTLTLKRKSNPWLGAENSHASKWTLRRLDKAFVAFFRRLKAGDIPGYPRFKARGRFNSVVYSYGDGARLDGSTLVLHPIGVVKVRFNHPVRGKIKTTIVKREIDNWYVTFVCDIGAPTAVPLSKPAVGIDLGLKALLVTSDGRSIAPPKFYHQAEAKLRRAQRRVSRRKKGSSRRRKAVMLLAKIHQRIARKRSEFHHIVSKGLVAGYGTICHESLNVKGLAQGSLSKSTLDAGWGQLLFFIGYKAEEAGSQVIAVDPRNTTQICNACGCLPDIALTLKDRIYTCHHCGYVADRDVNAARNILTLGNRAALARQPLTSTIVGVD